MAAGALVELFFAKTNRGLATLMFEQVQDHPYDLGTNFKLMAAFASNEVIIQTVTDLLTPGC